MEADVKKNKKVLKSSELSHLNFPILAFFTHFCQKLAKLAFFGIFRQFLTCLVTLFDRKLQIFKNSQN